MTKTITTDELEDDDRLAGTKPYAKRAGSVNRSDREQVSAICGESK